MIIPNGFRRHPEGIENDFDKREQRKLAYSAERRNRRTSEWRAKLARTFLSEEEEDEVKRRRSQPYNLKTSQNNLKTLKMKKRDTWKFIIQTIAAILTAIATSLGVTSCMSAL